MRARRRWFWLVYILSGLGAVSIFAAISIRIDGLERDRDSVQVRAAHRDRLRLAVWRMDGWLNALLAPEAARPPTDYDSPNLRQLRAAVGDFGAPPLAGFRSEWLQLHFSIGATGSLRSPQLAGDTGSTETRQIAAALGDASTIWNRLDSLRPFLEPVRVESEFEAATNAVSNRRIEPRDEPANGSAEIGAGKKPSQRSADFESRVEQSLQTRSQTEQQLAFRNIGSEALRVGPLLPVWLDHRDEEILVYLRRVEWNGRRVLQGFAVDWPKLRSELIGQVHDLFPEEAVDLRRAVDTPDSDLRSTLATAPLSLIVAEPEFLAASWTTTRTVLATAWTALLAAFCLIGLSMRRALGLAHRQAQFASAVTHELRSPLTTFRMYSEMLDEGMVRSEEQRRRYIHTLRGESDRLAKLVESVLTHARIERGSLERPRSHTTAQELCDTLLPTLNRTAETAGRSLVAQVDVGEAALDTDLEMIEQILTCLVDNACRHAEPATDRELLFSARVERDQLCLSIRDYGPGIPARRRRAIFRAFERGSGRSERGGDTLPDPGLGLGLPIARGLARALRGDLSIEDEWHRGAGFRLRVPLSAPGREQV